MKYINTFFILVLFTALNSKAQNNNNYTVTSFKKLDNSMTARIDAPKKDKNGDTGSLPQPAWSIRSCRPGCPAPRSRLRRRAYTAAG